MLKRKTTIDGDLTVTRLIREAAERSMKISIAPTSDNNVETPFGSGQVFIQEVQPGLTCELHALHCHRDLEVECVIEPQIVCPMALEGQMDGMDIKGYGVVEHPLNQGTLFGIGEPITCVRRVRAGQYFKTFGISLKPAFFARFADSFDDEKLAVLEHFRIGLRVEALPLSQRLIALGHNAFNHAYSGGLATLYQESNALQFVMAIVQLLREEDRLVQQIGRPHFDRLMHARAILDQSLLAPPKTLDLARQVGTNITTLQANFKLAFSTTIFGYIKSQRLEMARVLLIEHKLAVAEAAYRVGFSSPSAFTASYRRHFGHPPSAEVV